jgi:soluble lytic murein transglycosylase-like protein
MKRNGHFRRTSFVVLLAAMACVPLAVHAGAQVEEQLSPSMVVGLAKAIADAPVPSNYANRAEIWPWVKEMSPRIAHKVPDETERRELLATVHYESMRAGLDPQLVLAVIYHESGFKKFAFSSATARGYMQVMPFWVRQIGTPDQNLFNLRTNLRYGTVILRHYLDIENGDLYRALGRYNGSLGKPEYPTAVMAAMNRHFQYTSATAAPFAAATANAGNPSTLPR